VGGVPRVYVKEGDGFVPRVISVGLDNNRMIHITDGVKEGDVLMLAPPVKEQKREESGEPDKSKSQGRGENPESEKHRAVPPDSQPGPSGERPRRGGGGGRPRNVDNGAGEK